MRVNWDTIGATTSIACAIHCAVLPLLLTSLPLFGINIIHNHTFEFVMIALAFFIGIKALSHGWKHHSRNKIPVVLFALGMLFLFAKEIWHDHALYFLPVAVALIISAHFLNYKNCSKAGKCGRQGCSKTHV